MISDADIDAAINALDTAASLRIMAIALLEVRADLLLEAS